MVNSTNPICFLCGNMLIFVSQETVQPEGMRYPQTNTVYRCSNFACQEKKDKAKVEREKFLLNRATNEKDRLEKIQEQRKRGREVKVGKTKN